jgi:O-antigen/teichoic acid export membrane protein
VSGGFWRDGLRLGGGLAAAQAIGLLALPLWSRQFDAGAFAALGVWSAVVALVSVLVTLRYEAVLMLPAEDAEAAALWRLATRVVAAATAVGALVVALLPSAALQALGLGPLGSWGPAAVVAGGAAAWAGLAQAWLNRGRDWAAINRLRVGGALAGVVLVSAFGLAGWAPGLYLGQGLGALLGALAVWPALRRSLGPAAPPAGGWRALARRHLDAPRYLWPAALLDSFTQQWPFVLAAQWYGHEAAGAFTLAWRSLAVPMFMVSAALGAVFYQRFARGVEQDPVAARALLLGLWRRGALAALAATALLAWLAPRLAEPVFGAGWAAAGTMAAALAPLVCLMALSSATSSALLVLGGQALAPLFGVAMLLGRPAAFWWAAASGDLHRALMAWLALEALLILLYNLEVWRRLQRRCGPTP